MFHGTHTKGLICVIFVPSKVYCHLCVVVGWIELRLCGFLVFITFYIFKAHDALILHTDKKVLGGDYEKQQHIASYDNNFSMFWKESRFSTFSNWWNVIQDPKQSGHAHSLSCRELKWGDQRMRELIHLWVEEKNGDKEEMCEQRCLQFSSISTFFFSPTFSLSSDRNQLVCGDSKRCTDERTK